MVLTDDLYDFHLAKVKHLPDNNLKTGEEQQNRNYVAKTTLFSQFHLI